MASSLSTPFSASFSTAGNSTHHNICSLSNLSFRLSPNLRIRFFNKGLHHSQNSSALIKSQSNGVAVDDGSSNAAATPPAKSGEPAAEAKDSMTSSDAPPALAIEESISEFLTQVSSLVKLVDSRYIVELQLKQLDCELIIRKKEVLHQLPSSAPVVMMHSPSTLPAMPPTQTAPTPAPSVSAPSSPPSPFTTAAKSAKSLLPPLKCPMAGTFYRSPAPAELPFVGDKVRRDRS